MGQGASSSQTSSALTPEGLVLGGKINGLRGDVSSSGPQSARGHLPCTKRVYLTAGTSETRKTTGWPVENTAMPLL